MAETLFEVSLAGGAASGHWASAKAAYTDVLDWDSLHPEQYSPSLLAHARVGWTENAFNEFCTAAAMGQLVTTLCQAGAPLDLIGMASAFPLEEIVHVELCARVAMRLGGGVPIAYDPDDLLIPLDPDLTPLQRANELVVRLCCVGEEFSLPMLTGCMSAASHPLTRAVLTRIVRDEAAHGRLGWLYLDWIAASLDRTERDRLVACARDAARPMHEFWQRQMVDDQPMVPFAPGFHDMGWMEPAAYVTLARRTLDETIFDRLKGYGIG